MDIASQKTVVCTPAPDGNGYAGLLTIDGVSLTIDTNMMHPNMTVIVIEGRRYFPLETSIEIVSDENGASVVTTVAVTAG